MRTLTKLGAHRYPRASIPRCLRRGAAGTSSCELPAAAPAPFLHSDGVLLLASVTWLSLSFGAAIYRPALLFFALPLLFGVPHVAADLRHLVVRRDLPVSWRRTIWLACGAWLALRGLAAFHPVHGLADVETLLAVTWALLAVQATGRREPVRKPLAVGIVLTVGLAMLHDPQAVRLALLHGHNLISLLLAALLFRARSRAFLLAAALSLALAAVLATGVFHRVTLEAAAALHGRLFEARLFGMADQIAPGLRVEQAIGITSSFLFLQAVHYFVWLGVIPRQDRAGVTSAIRRPLLIGSRLARELRSVRGNEGWWWFAAVAVASGATIVAGAFQPQATRTLYLSLATFHVHLELVMLLYFWVARGSERPSAAGELTCSH